MVTSKDAPRPLAGSAGFGALACFEAGACLPMIAGSSNGAAFRFRGGRL